MLIKNLYHRAIQLIPEIKNGTAGAEETELLLKNIRSLMKSDPASGKELGPLIPEINKAIKSRATAPRLDWVPVNNGFLALGHKPGGKISFEGLKLAGTTAVLTLLMENEGAKSIGSGLEKVGIEWIWFPFSAVRPVEKTEVEKQFQYLETLLRQGGHIYIHCSAGIHRTGMIAYAFLRYLGQTPEQALTRLSDLRKITAEGATEKRLAWGDKFANS